MVFPMDFLIPVLRRTAKWLPVLVLAALLGACEKDEPLPYAAVPQADATFECGVPESLRGKAVNVFLDASRVGEVSEEAVLALKGRFAAYAVGLTLRDGTTISIDLDEPMAFTAKGQTLHTGCEQFKWASMGNLTLFEYSHGAANPFPAQQLMYSHGPTPDFKNLRPLLAGGNKAAFYEREGDRCLSGFVQGDGEVEQWCYQSGKLYQTRKMLKGSLPDGGYRFVCDFSGEGPLLIDASVVKSGPNPTPSSPEESARATAAFTDQCLAEKALLKAKAIDET
jgi:hypothetical protein